MNHALLKAGIFYFGFLGFLGWAFLSFMAWFLRGIGRSEPASVESIVTWFVLISISLLYYPAIILRKGSHPSKVVGLLFQLPLFVGLGVLWSRHSLDELARFWGILLAISAVALGGFFMWCTYLYKLGRDRMRVKGDSAEY